MTLPSNGSVTFNLDDQVTYGLTISSNQTLSGGTLSVAVGGSNPAVGAVTLSGILGGTGGLTMTGPGVLKLNAANTYSGNTFISGGTLGLVNSLALQDSTVDTSGSGALSFGAYVGHLRRPHQRRQPGPDQYRQPGRGPLRGQQRRQHELLGHVERQQRKPDKIGSGVLVLSSTANSFGGSTAGLTISAGSLQLAAGDNIISSGNSTGVPLAINGGVLDVNGNAPQVVL